VNRDDVYALIDAERLRQAGKWGSAHIWGMGDCSSRNVPTLAKVAILTEECGEVSEAVLDGGPIPSATSARSLRDELVQVAAVAVAWLESFPADTQDPLPGMGGPTVRSHDVGTDARPPVSGAGT